MTIGECIRTLRASAGLKQHELAARAGVSASMLSLIESGKREPTIPMLRSIAGALGVLVRAGNQAARGAAVDPNADRFVTGFGPSILAELDASLRRY